jgi:hypothetical protein
MKFALASVAAALALAAAISVDGQIEAARAAAAPSVFVTGIMATIPDPNKKVPTLDMYPGAGIPTWSDGRAQAVLIGGDTYEYCVSVASATASGTGSIAYKIVRGKTVIQTATVIDSFPVSSDGIWYYCAGNQLPVSPGTAKLVGTFTYTPTGGKPETASLSIPVLLQ